MNPKVVLSAPFGDDVKLIPRVSLVHLLQHS